MSETETLQLNCPQCKGLVRVLASTVGRRVRCPRCQADFKVPGVPAPKPGAPANAAADDDDDWLNLDQPLPVAGSKTLSPGTPATPSSPTPLPSQRDEFGFPLSAAPASTSTGDPLGDSLPAPPKNHVKNGTAGVFSNDDWAALEGALGGFAEGADGSDAFLGDGQAAAEDMLGEDDVVGEFRVTCLICGSVTYARPDQVGKQIKCHDCYSPITVPKPPKPKKVYQPDIENAPMFNMFDPGEAPPSFNAPGVKTAQELLLAAEAADDLEDTDYDDPDVKNWLIGIFRIFLDPQVPVHWLFLSVLGSGLGIVSVLIPQMMVLAPMIVVTLFYWAFVFACGFSIMEAVSNNAKRVSSWPYMDPSEWFGQMATVVCAASMCLAPPVLFGMIVIGPHLLTVAIAMFSLFLFFPFVLMSMLDSGNVFVPFSAEVTKSVTRCQEQWGVLYLSSALLFIGLFFFFIICSFMPSIVAAVFVYGATVAGLFTYFSMLGRLAYAIGHAVNAPPK